MLGSLPGDAEPKGDVGPGVAGFAQAGDGLAGGVLKAARRAARAADSARTPPLPLALPLRRRQRRSAGAKSVKPGPLDIQQVSPVRVGRPCSRCRDCPGPVRTCPDQEVAAIGSRDTTGQDWRGAADVAGRQAPGYCRLVNALATGAGAPGGGVVGRDPPDQARLRQLAEEQAVLRRIATLVARGEPPEEVFAAVAEEVGRLLAVDFAILVRYDSQDTLEVVGTWTRTGAPAPTPVGGQLPLGGRNVTTLVYRTGRPVRIDYSDVSGVIGQVASRDWGLRSSIGVPISAESRLWGCIVVAFSGQELRLLPADTEARLASFTELVATAIANADSRAELARLAEEQAALRRVATLVAHGVPPEDVFAAVIEEIARLLPVNVAGIVRYDPDGMFTYVAAWGKAVDYVPPVGSRWMLGGHNLGTLVFETGRPARLDHYVDNSSGAGQLRRPQGGLRHGSRSAGHRRGPSLGPDRRLLDPGTAAAAGHRGAPGLVHGAGGDGDRERRQPR